MFIEYFTTVNFKLNFFSFAFCIVFSIYLILPAMYRIREIAFNTIQIDYFYRGEIC